MDFTTIIILICSGILVGTINTFAAGGVVISTSVFVAFGMPITMALGTNRICIFLQNLVSTLQFHRQGLINFRPAIRLFYPMGFGALIGALVVNRLPEPLVTSLFAAGSIFSMVMIFGRKETMERANDGLDRPPGRWQDLLLALTGFYAGSIYVGVGYMMLALFMFGLGYDIIRANALKGFSALILSLVTVVPFIVSGNIDYLFGAVHSVGNMTGAYLAARNARAIGVKYIRWIMVVMILISVSHTVYVEFLK